MDQTREIIQAIQLMVVVFLMTQGICLGHEIECVSVDDLGNQGNSGSNMTLGDRHISHDGRFVVFHSLANNLVPDDTTFLPDVFVFDRQTKTIERVSVNDAGDEGDKGGGGGSISQDGRFVAFMSKSTNLVVGDTNARGDIFVYDRQSDTIERVSVNDLGQEGTQTSTNHSISADGRFVAFDSLAFELVLPDTNNTWDVFVFDRSTNTIEMVSVNDAGQQGNATSLEPSISGDGRYVAFTSTATNLVSLDTNACSDVFVFDRQTDTIERISIDDAGNEGNESGDSPTISTNGRFVVFRAYASNLVPGDTNGLPDIFVYDRTLNNIECVSVNNAGDMCGSGSIASISPCGRYAAFSGGDCLSAEDTNGLVDVFIHDTQTKTTTLISKSGSGAPGNNASNLASVSNFGNHVVFVSSASNLIPDDTNGWSDVFVVWESLPSPTPEPKEILVYPNPFNPDEAVGGTLKFKGLPDGTKVSIYTVSGELVVELKEANGQVFWDGKNKNGAMVSMGSYAYVIKKGKETLKRGKIVVVK